jgi:V/A-type H+-transporting ATPase subunit K
MKSHILFAFSLTLGVAVLAFLSSIILWNPGAFAGDEVTQALRLESGAWQWGYMAAALVTGLSSLASAYAVASVGSAAMGVLVEKPELFGRVVILVGLSEGIAIYGLIVSVLILNSLS